MGADGSMETASPRGRAEGEGSGAPRSRRVAAELSEADTERMAALRSGLRDIRLQREKREEQQREKDRELAEAWRRRNEERAARAKEEREEQLSRLQASKFSARSAAEDLGDEEYRELLAKYGGRLRSPRAPPAEAESPGRSLSAGGQVSSRFVGTTVPPPVPPPPRKPRVPPAPRPRRPVGGSAARAAQDSRPTIQATSSVHFPASPGGGGRRASDGPAGACRVSLSAGNAGAATGALPPVLMSPRGTAGVGLGDHEVGGAAGAGGAGGGHGAAAEGSDPEVAGPHRSLMPKKERLRKKQQELLKKTDVSFYRQHMRRHFQRIVEAVELTFSDTTKKKKVNMNLSKPLTVTELRNLAPAGVRQQ